MMKKQCEETQKLLVDYSDGLLSQQETNLVSQHLDECENCRKLYEALGRSLELSNIIWEDNLIEIENAASPVLPKAKKIHWLRYVSVAAGVLLIITTGILWHSFSESEKPKIQLSFEEIEKNINDSGSAAYLLAATELLAEYPDYKQMAESQYHYIAKTFQGTPAAEKIKLKIQ